MRIILLLTLIGFSVAAKGQFYTIQPEKKVNTVDERMAEQAVALPQSKKTEEKEIEEYFSTGRGKQVEIQIEKDIPLFVNATDSLLFGLLSERMNVCLPLDFLQMNSGYGYRKDPFTKCEKFHDGIDLQCHHSKVYSMLPAIVKEVHFGKRGYGNYVVLDHGSFLCTYAHLSTIFVTKGAEIPAGTVVGISGNTGRSTGEHLHIRLWRQKDGKEFKSINPEPFIAYMNRYIKGLQDKMAFLKFGVSPDMELNIANLAKVMEQYDIKFPKIVMAQCILETGYMSSHVCTEYNNLFGLRRPSDGSYYRFNRWEESVKAYRDYVQYKYKGGDYYAFLKNIGYASDPYYVLRVKEIARNL